ncbi:hypothetical protein Tco_1220982 [Tanacetum coccineum]
MRTRNSNFPNNSNVTIPRCRNKGRAPNIVEPELRTIVAPMAERTMEELLRAPTEGYGEAIVVERETEETTDKEQSNFQGSTAQIPPLVTPIPISEPDVPKTLPKTTPIPEPDVPKSLPKPHIPYPSRLNQEKSRDKASNQKEKIFQMFQDLRFDISFADALLLIPRFAPTIKSLLMNKEKLLELAKIPLNKNCSAMLLKKLLEKLGDPEIEAYLKDDSISPEIDHADCDPEEDIFTEAKSSIEEPPELELKDLPSHLEYAYLEENDKLPVIIAKGLKDDEKEALLKVLKSHKRAIAWKITDIKGIDPRFCTHKILMEDDYKPTVQSQRRVNPKIHEVIKKEVLKLLDAGMIYPISDSPWVSPVHCVPKKGGITVVANEENELIPTRLVNTAVRPVNTAGLKPTVVKDTTARDKIVVSEIKEKGLMLLRPQLAGFRKPKIIGNPQQKEYKEKGVIDSGCSRHMTRNKCYLTEYEDYDGGFVSFGDGKGRISRKGKIKTGILDFDNVYFCKEFKYNLFSVSQICDKKNNVLFTDTECVTAENFRNFKGLF